MLDSEAMMRDSMVVSALAHHLPALKLYLHLGFEPLLCQDGMKRRWSAVGRKLGM